MKRVFLTGAGSGIGLAIAKLLVAFERFVRLVSGRRNIYV